jgi:hypothetical protein
MGVVVHTGGFHAHTRGNVNCKLVAVAGCPGGMPIIYGGRAIGRFLDFFHGVFAVVHANGPAASRRIPGKDRPKIRRNLKKS